MSQRFYINGFQPFGNNEIGKRTLQFLQESGIEMDMDDGIIDEQEISNPQGLLEAVTYDSLSMLKDGLTQDTYDDDLKKIHHSWSEVTDKDILCHEYFSPTYFKDALYRNDEPSKTAYWRSYFYLSGNRALMPGLLYVKLLEVCDEKDDGLHLKAGCKVTVRMY
ncbi:MAG: hypothetical protein MJZ34_02630 [Paludibacteraceae bacterium]|nr:hypothetical protein [Paludibacteraceae bacterium]